MPVTVCTTCGEAARESACRSCGDPHSHVVDRVAATPDQRLLDSVESALRETRFAALEAGGRAIVMRLTAQAGVLQMRLRHATDRSAEAQRALELALVRVTRQLDELIG